MPSSNLYNNVDNWDAETRRSRAASSSTYGRAIPSDPWEQLQYRTREASGLQRRPSTTIVDDAEYRTVDLVWGQPTRTITTEDLRRAYTSLLHATEDLQRMVQNTISSYRDPISRPTSDTYPRVPYDDDWRTTVFTSCGVSAQPTRPRITFGEL